MEAGEKPVAVKEPIHASFRWTVDEVLVAKDYAFRHSCRPAFRILLHLLFLSALVAGVLSIVQVRWTFPGIALSLAGIYWFVLRRFERRWTVQRRLRLRPDRDSAVEYQITPDQLVTRTQHSRSELGWEIFSKSVQTPAGFLLYLNEQLFHWLPKHAFVSDADFERFAGLVRQKVRRVYTIA